MLHTNVKIWIILRENLIFLTDAFWAPWNIVGETLYSDNLTLNITWLPTKPTHSPDTIKYHPIAKRIHTSSMHSFPFACKVPLCSCWKWHVYLSYMYLSSPGYYKKNYMRVSCDIHITYVFSQSNTHTHTGCTVLCYFFPRFMVYFLYCLYVPA